VLAAGYRGDGLRAWKQSSAGRTYFLYDGEVPVAELSQAGAVVATNSFSASGLVSRHVNTISVFYAFDPQGSLPQRLDSGQNVLSHHFYTAQGAPISTSTADPFGYKAQWGYYTHHETGLQLLTHRYYDPQAGRFLTRDPIGYAGGVNLYGYVTNNYVNRIDPRGFNGQAMTEWQQISQRLWPLLPAAAPALPALAPFAPLAVIGGGAAYFYFNPGSPTAHYNNNAVSRANGGTSCTVGNVPRMVPFLPPMPPITPESEPRCVLQWETPPNRGVKMCVYKCRGWGSLVTLPFPEWAPCPPTSDGTGYVPNPPSPPTPSH